jgi:CHAT domain-containing protein
MGALHDGRRYLVEQFALARETQAVTAQTQKSSGRRAVGLGVSRALDGHQALVGVREELAAVIRTARRRRGGVLPGIIRLDRAFTAGALVRALSSQYSVIHVASHFVFAAAHEDSSYLLLGDGAKLTLAEFGDLRFDTMDLVVLSACNTAIGGGHSQNGREIEGLGALVRYQGANQVLATLWSVADMTTASLMRAFYHNRYRSKLAPPEALRRAQLDLLSGAVKSPARVQTRALVDPDEDRTDAKPDARHPFYWAPYILMGAFAETPT